MSQPLTVTSDAFAEGGSIPSVHTCDGKDVSPRITVGGLSGSAKTWALLCDDPDAPGGDWVHWLVFNLPAALTDLPPGVTPEVLAAKGGVHGRNSWGNSRYQGPCPPSGTHRYIFKVFALDAALDLPEGASKAQFLAAAKGRVLGHAMLTGRYARPR
ncbi:YbhB/YbcL family Raf kinase inhibitor-like protein [Fundidesulfovibrio terrae]|uniref:YbhB/YbcL family Raf kinase inhibitor-like protein n=1 Tax=Fundidesulfovibrio terrae TaxID=2922866 RepID=UPI001FAFA181|nr:YbhB/YbcL family Raf kinase inhibitor-like protein [Fundidesulfovibrio terrae]